MTSAVTAAAAPLDRGVDAPPAVSRLRMGLALVALAAVGMLAATPFLLPVLKRMLAGRTLPLSVGAILALQDIQLLAFVSLAVTAGVWTAPRVGLDAPLVRARLGGQPVGKQFLRLIPGAVLAGTLSAAAVLLLSLALKSRLPKGVGEFPSMGPWTTATAAFYGGIVEELLCRWGLLALFAFGLARAGVSRGTGFWVANVAAALCFGLLHLPAAVQLGMRPTPLVLLYLLGGNGVVGLVCGWLFRRRGLESAMVSHASADLWLHTVFPVLGL